MFSTNPGDIKDWSGMSSADIFNQSVVPIFKDLDDNTERLRKETQSNDDANLLSSNDTDEFVSSLLQQRSQQPQTNQAQMEDYNAPIARTTGAVGTEKESLKLSNYGYDSDSSPDYNSNVLKVGNANNPLKDGLSAALSKTVADRYGLKTGDMFEATTADGKTLTRRYDDTVPTHYKGKPLPETLDLYELKGNNNFSGKVVGIKPIKK